MNTKEKNTEMSLINKTKELRDELKMEVNRIKDRLKVLDAQIMEATTERNDLTTKLRRLEPWLIRVEKDLTYLQPVEETQNDADEDDVNRR